MGEDDRSNLVPVDAAGLPAFLCETYGVEFDGNPWMLMSPVALPKETQFVAAVNPLTVRITEHLPTGTQFALIDTDYGYVLRFQVTLFDDPTNPFLLRQPLNPAGNAAGPDLAQLAEQELLRIVFLDALDGSFITVRHLPIDEDTRATLRQIVALGEARPSSPALWQAAVTAAAPAL